MSYNDELNPSKKWHQAEDKSLRKYADKHRTGNTQYQQGFMRGQREENLDALYTYKTPKSNPLNPCECGLSLIARKRNPTYGGVTISGWNQKLGPIMGFSISRGVTCPGQSDWCRQFCYARTDRHTVTTESRAKNLIASRNEHFVDDMVYGIRELLRTGIPLRVPTNEDRKLGREATGPMTGMLRMEKIFRIHTSGDFYSEDYVRKWLEIVRELPDIKFYTYTRCWRPMVDPRITNAVYDLKNVRNVSILASTDPTTGPAPRGWRECGIDATWLGQKAFRCPHNDTSYAQVLCVDCQHCMHRYADDVYLPHHSMGVLQEGVNRELKRKARQEYPSYGTGQEDWDKNPNIRRQQ